jgi:hypothetical protein
MPIFLSSPDQSPASLAIQILLEMKRLDLHHTANPVTSSPASEPLQQLEHQNSPSPFDRFMDNCGYIVQWLLLASSNRIKPVRYSLARNPEIIQWYASQKSELVSKTSILTDITSTTDSHKNKIVTLQVPSPLQTSTPSKHIFLSSTDQNIQQLTISTLIEMKDSLKAARLRAERKDEKKERGFHKLPHTENY